MILRTKGIENRITVEITGAQQLHFRSAYPCDLCPEALVYAVCRFLSCMPSLLNPLAEESCRMRFSKGKGRRPVRRRFTAPALLLELPGVWAVVDLLVGPETITVTGLTLSPEFPTGDTHSNVWFTAEGRVMIRPSAQQRDCSL